MVLGGDPDIVGAVLAAAETTQGLTQTTSERRMEKGVNARRESVNDITLVTPDATASGRIDTRFAPTAQSAIHLSESHSRRRMLRSDARCRRKPPDRVRSCWIAAMTLRA